MHKILDISLLIKDKKEAHGKKRIDVEAAYAILDECLEILRLNPLPELQKLKRQIEITIKELEETGKEWHQT